MVIREGRAFAYTIGDGDPEGVTHAITFALPIRRGFWPSLAYVDLDGGAASG
jgi:hypothetical protein